VCDCDADVRETIRGEFQRDPITLPTCTSAPDDPTGCAPGDGGMLEQQLFDGGLPTTDWLAGATGEVDPAAAYPSLRAWIVDEVTASDSSDGGCPCLPCRVEYEVQGRL
jgi:hypothetical protein